MLVRTEVLAQPESTPTNAVGLLDSDVPELRTPQQEGRPYQWVEWCQPTQRELVYTLGHALGGQLSHLSERFGEPEVYEVRSVMMAMGAKAASDEDPSEAMQRLKAYASNERSPIVFDETLCLEGVFGQISKEVERRDRRRGARIKQSQGWGRMTQDLLTQNANEAEGTKEKLADDDTADFPAAAQLAEQLTDTNTRIKGERYQKFMRVVCREIQDLEPSEVFLHSFNHVKTLLSPMPEFSHSQRQIVREALNMSMQDIMGSALRYTDEDYIDRIALGEKQLSEVQRLHEAMQWLEDPGREVTMHPLFAERYGDAAGFK